MKSSLVMDEKRKSLRVKKKSVDIDFPSFPEEELFPFEECDTYDSSPEWSPQRNELVDTTDSEWEPAIKKSKRKRTKKVKDFKKLLNTSNPQPSLDEQNESIPNLQPVLDEQNVNIPYLQPELDKQNVSEQSDSLSDSRSLSDFPSRAELMNVGIETKETALKKFVRAKSKSKRGRNVNPDGLVEQKGVSNNSLMKDKLFNPTVGQTNIIKASSWSTKQWTKKKCKNLTPCIENTEKSLVEEVERIKFNSLEGDKLCNKYENKIIGGSALEPQFDSGVEEHCPWNETRQLKQPQSPHFNNIEKINQGHKDTESEKGETIVRAVKSFWSETNVTSPLNNCAEQHSPRAGKYVKQLSFETNTTNFRDYFDHLNDPSYEQQLESCSHDYNLNDYTTNLPPKESLISSPIITLTPFTEIGTVTSSNTFIKENSTTDMPLSYSSSCTSENYLANVPLSYNDTYIPEYTTNRPATYNYSLDNLKGHGEYFGIQPLSDSIAHTGPITGGSTDLPETSTNVPVGNEYSHDNVIGHEDYTDLQPSEGSVGLPRTIVSGNQETSTNMSISYKPPSVPYTMVRKDYIVGANKKKAKASVVNMSVRHNSSMERRDYLPTLVVPGISCNTDLLCTSRANMSQRYESLSHQQQRDIISPPPSFAGNPAKVVQSKIINEPKAFSESHKHHSYPSTNLFSKQIMKPIHCSPKQNSSSVSKTPLSVNRSSDIDVRVSPTLKAGSMANSDARIKLHDNLPVVRQLYKNCNNVPSTSSSPKYYSKLSEPASQPLILSRNSVDQTFNNQPERCPSVFIVKEVQSPPKIVHKCLQCARIFPSIDLLNRHHNKIHLQNNYKSISCNICSANFPNKNELQYHQQCFHLVKPSLQMVLPVMDFQNDVNIHPMLSSGINSYLPLTNIRNIGDSSSFGIPIITLDNLNVKFFDRTSTTSILSFGALKTMEPSLSTNR